MAFAAPATLTGCRVGFGPSPAARRAAGIRAPTLRAQKCCNPARVVRVCAQASGAEAVAYVNDESFKEMVLQAKLPVLLDFTAPWCGPCRMIAPLVEELAVEYEGRLQVYKVNVDDSPKTAKEFKLKSIPVCMVFKDGKQVGQVVGAVKKPALYQLISKHLA